jgi:hypothetical protein
VSVIAVSRLQHQLPACPPCLSNRNPHQLSLLSSPMFLNVERRSGDLGRIRSQSCLTLADDFGRHPWVAEHAIVPDSCVHTWLRGTASQTTKVDQMIF